MSKNVFSDIALHELKLVRASAQSDLSSLSAIRKHAYSNILKIPPPKTESFQIKNLIFFHISAQYMN